MVHVHQSIKYYYIIHTSIQDGTSSCIFLDSALKMHINQIIYSEAKITFEYTGRLKMAPVVAACLYTYTTHLTILLRGHINKQHLVEEDYAVIWWSITRLGHEE
jgi:hypothetical protein